MKRSGPSPSTRFAVPVAVIALGLVTAACGAGTPRSTASSSTSYEGTWRLTEGRGPSGVVPIVKGYRITLDISHGRVGGSAACNTYGGEVEIGGGSFNLEGVEMTQMGCNPRVTRSEETYVEALLAADAIEREADTLIISGPQTELSFALLPAPPTAELTDTRWKLESLIHGTGSEATVSSADPAHLILRSDGTLAGTTGCRDLKGKWIEQGDEILFTDLSADGRCSAELREQDAHVVGVLGDGFTAEIDGQHLILVSRGDLGLRYTADAP